MYLIDELATPLTADTSYALTGIDEDGVRRYETTTYHSPGYENTEEGFCRVPLGQFRGEAARWSSTRYVPIPRWVFPTRTARL